jgi:hypothetical protein
MGLGVAECAHCVDELGLMGVNQSLTHEERRQLTSAIQLTGFASEPLGNADLSQVILDALSGLFDRISGVI